MMRGAAGSIGRGFMSGKAREDKKNRRAGRWPGRAPLAGLAAIAAMAALPALAQTTGRNPSHEDILRGFDIAALYADKDQGRIGYGSGATLTGVVTKWTGPVRYRIEGMDYDKARIAESIAALNRLAGIAGVTVEPAGTGNPNFSIIFVNTEDLRTSNGGRAGCITSWNEDKWYGRLHWAKLTINLGHRGDIGRCIVHEMLHAFGLRGHPHRLHSILSYSTDRFVFDLTEADTVMLQTLYDKRIPAGLARLPAVALADGIIEEKRRALNPAAPPKSAAEPVLDDILADLRKAADDGNVRAMLHLAEAYRFGIRLPKDMAQMAALLDRADALTDMDRVFDLAYALQFGRHVPKDLPRAAAIYRRGAEAGFTAFQNNLGTMLRDGTGIPPDQTEALMWFTIAARARHAMAESNRSKLSETAPGEVQAAAIARADAWKPAATAAKQGP